MTPEHWQRIRTIFAAAVGIAPDERSTYLKRQCEGDTSLLAVIESILRHDAAAEADPLEGTTVAQRSPEVAMVDPYVGRRLGPYQIQQPLGSGGMGTVYRATRVDDYQQVVAIKVIRQGLESNEHRKRFHTERQVLAGLNHPHVARLLDGGQTDDGQPYLVMEFIDGMPLDRFCDRRGLFLDKRLELFRQVCLAVHHAHVQHVIHRDLKPANVLVTPDQVPKVTDFGLAKSLQGAAHGDVSTVAWEPTQSGAILGTPGYLAPEQAGSRHDQVGVPADVYGLGAILYHLLTGRPPFRGETVLQTLKQVVEEEPLPPERLHAGLPRDVNTICMKCLQKDVTRRYPSAAALADDVQRYLSGEPIQARAIGRVERTRRWCRRNPRVAGLATLLFVVVVAAFVSVTYLWRLAAARRDDAIAQSQRADAATTTAWLREKETFAGARSEVRSGGATGAKGSGKVDQTSKEVLEGTLRYYQRLLDQEPHSIPIRRDVALANEALGLLHTQAGLLSETAAYLHLALSLREELAKLDPNLRNEQTWVLEQLGNLEENTEKRRGYHLRVATLREEAAEAHPEDHRKAASVGFSYHNLGFAAAREKDYVEARIWYEKARNAWEKGVAAEPTSATYLGQLALTLRDVGHAYLQLSDVAELQGQADVAQQLWQKALDAWEKARTLRVQLARSHPHDTNNVNELASVAADLASVQMLLDQVEPALRTHQLTCEALEALLTTRTQRSIQDVINPVAKAHEDWAAACDNASRAAESSQAKAKARSIRMLAQQAKPRGSSE